MGSGRTLLRYLTFVLLGCLGLAVTASGHDVPNARIERSTQINLLPGRLRVDYEVILAELTLVQDLRQIDAERIEGDRATLFERYARVVGPLNARGFLVQVDGSEVELDAMDFSIVVEDHPRFRFRFEAAVPASGRLIVTDTNYASSEGATRLAFRADPGLQVVGTLPPTEVESIPYLPSWQQTDEEERRSKRLEVAYSPQASITSAPTPTAAGHEPRASRPTLGTTSGLTWLLDRPTGMAGVSWLLTAVLLGMIHAIQPGHGKTLVAAASLDASGGLGRKAGLGLLAAACHLVGVVAIAAVLWWFPTNRFGAIHVVIARGAGFIVAAIGCFRVGRHLAGLKPSHEHLPATAAGFWSLGVAAGFIPCWDAVALIMLANSVNQLAWGMTLLVGFSLGLAVVLVGVASVASRFRRRIETGGRSGQTLRWLGLASGVVLALIGLGLLAT